MKQRFALATFMDWHAGADRLRRITHPDPDEDDGGGEIPLVGTGGPACRRGASE